MRLTMKLSGLLTILLVAFSLLGAHGAGAQDISTPAATLNLGELDGIQNGVIRSYSIDYTAMMQNMSTPGANMQMPSGLFVLLGGVIEFDSADHAKSAFDKVKADPSLAADVGAGGTSEAWDSGLGDQSVGYKTTDTSSGMTTNSVTAVFQKDNYIYVTTAIGVNTDVEQSAKDLGQQLLNNDGSGAGDFKSDGTSTGGLWDKFPKADDALIANLITSDQILYPEPESTPAS